MVRVLIECINENDASVCCDNAEEGWECVKVNVKSVGSW